MLIFFIAIGQASATANGHSAKKIGDGAKGATESIQTNGLYSPMDINNIFNYYGNNGDGSYNNFSGSGEGFEFPIGSNAGTTIFEDGLVWTAHKNGTLLCGGSTYWHGLQAGKILTNGTASTLPNPDDPTKAEYRVYRVRPDMKLISGVTNPDDPQASAELAALANEVRYINRFQNHTAEQLLQQYWDDWNNWPASEGAPFTDANGAAHYYGGSGYDPTTCTPGFPGADQTEWMVMNDVNANLTHNLYGSDPIGIEIQRTIWAYNLPGPLGNTIFISYKFINKSGVQLDSMYVSQWSDPDLGDAGDDAVGCDTTLRLGYVYNGRANDANYTNLSLAPPAVGFVFLQGPIVPGTASDTAFFDLKKISGKKNLPMTSFSFFINGDSTFIDPSHDLAGTQQWYNLMRGLVSSTGQPFPSKVTNGSNYCYPGDPVTNTGPTYIGAASVAPPRDVRICMNSGPFTMAPGDTQQVVVGAIAGLGGDYLSSINALKAEVAKGNAFVRGTPVASIEDVDSIYSTNSTINFHAGAVVSTGTIVSRQWLIAQKPNSSTASLVTADSVTSHIQADVPGIYRIGYAVSASNGNKDTAYVQFQVVANSAPVASFVTSASSISIGDTLHLDGSATHDNDGDVLKYSWNVTGNDMFDRSVSYDTLRGELLDPHSVTASYVPLRASTLNISLEARDSFFINTALHNVIVNPVKTNNVQVNASYNSGLFPISGIYGHGAIRTFPDNSVWVNNGGVYFPLNFSDLTHPAQSYEWSFASNFYIGNNLIFLALSRGGVNILQTNGSGLIGGTGFISAPQTVSTLDSISYDVYYKSPYLFVSNGTAGIYVYNVSNPASPSLVNKFSNGQKWTTLCVDGNHLYGANPLTQQALYADVSTPSSVTLATAHVNHAYTAIKKAGQYFYLFKSDTIGIYDLSNFTSPVLKSEIPVPHTLNTANIIYDVSGDGTTLMIGTAEGVYFYDVTNASAPSQIGKFITGYEATRVYYDGTHILAASNGRGLSGGYEGYTVFEPTITGVASPVTNVVPLQYTLLQNYPNPFNPSTTIRYGLPVRSQIKVEVFNTLGQTVKVLTNAVQDAGYHEVEWNASVSSGMYFYRISATPLSGGAKSFVEVRKMLLLK